MASAKALAVSSSKRHPRIAVVTSPRRRRRHHRRIVVRAERCRIATRAERERPSPSSPRCRRRRRRDAVAPSESAAVVGPSVVVTVAVVRAPRDAPPRRRRIVASSPSSPSSFSLFWLPTTAFRGRHQHLPVVGLPLRAPIFPRRRRCRRRCYHRGLFPAYSPFARRRHHRIVIVAI